MGKLHTLRRAIERNPEEWVDGDRAKGAQRVGVFSWKPQEPWWFHSKSYRSFVRYVLRSLGYNV